MGKIVYPTIVKSVKNGSLKEPFRAADVVDACPELNVSTPRVFLSKHCVGNPSGTSELFERVAFGLYRCVRPFLYDLDNIKGTGGYMQKNTTMNLELGIIVLTPLMYANMSHDMFGASRGYTPDTERALIKYYLYCVSIELGFKAAILASECTEDMKKYLKNKIRHNLDEAYIECAKRRNLDFLNSNDIEVIKKINPYYQYKGLEYFTGNMMEAFVTGLKTLPDVDELERTACKVQEFLERKQRFKNC